MFEKVEFDDLQAGNGCIDRDVAFESAPPDGGVQLLAKLAARIKG